MTDDPKKESEEPPDTEQASEPAVDDPAKATDESDALGEKSRTPNDVDEDGGTQDGKDSEESDSDSDSAGSKAATTKKRRRNVLYGIAGCLLVILALVISGVFEPSSETTVVEIAPQVIFEGLIAKVKAGESKAIHVDSFEIDDKMIEAIGGLDSLETLIVDQGTLTDASMETIASLPNLQHLRLRLSPITDEGLKTLAKCSSLWFLNLPHANCTADGIETLADLTHLRQLRLGSKNLGNEVSRKIVKIESLRGIHLIGIAITDDGLKLIADMPHLESLYLDDCAVTTAGWDWVFAMKPQLHVHVDQQHHDRDPKAHSHR